MSSDLKVSKQCVKVVTMANCVLDDLSDLPIFWS